MTTHAGRADEAQTLEGAPWYAQAVYKFGIVACIAGYLVWFMVNVLSVRLDTNLELLRQIQWEHRDMGFYLRAICLNISKDVDKPNCYPPVRAETP